MLAERIANFRQAPPRPREARCVAANSSGYALTPKLCMLLSLNLPEKASWPQQQSTRSDYSSMTVHLMVQGLLCGRAALQVLVAGQPCNSQVCSRVAARFKGSLRDAAGSAHP